MVRYDFFPEFLLWSMEEGNELKLLWVSFKKERSKGKKISFWKKLFLKNASKIIFATVSDLEEGVAMNLSGEVYDFRIVQIHRRMISREDKLNKELHLYPELKNLKNSFRQAVIMGNVWPSDLFLLKDLPEDVFILIVPHLLSHDVLNAFHERLKCLGRDAFELADFCQELPVTSTVILNKKGVLCELYSDFDFSYVGGGFEGSIHSVLEPLVAGCLYISCGPKHHRSSEYDLAKEMRRITEINTPEQFYLWFIMDDNQAVHGKMDSMLDCYKTMRELVI